MVQVMVLEKVKWSNKINWLLIMVEMCRRKLTVED